MGAAGSLGARADFASEKPLAVFLHCSPAISGVPSLLASRQPCSFILRQRPVGFSLP
jgi:hypothetical protein